VTSCRCAWVRAAACSSITPTPSRKSSSCARWFDDPEAFRPERWASDAARRLPRFAYLPFGGGPRQCIGNTFATKEAVLVLATIARRFRLALVPGLTVTPVPYITLRPEPGIRMRVELR
jgi:cytochrome P450